MTTLAIELPDKVFSVDIANLERDLELELEDFLC